MTTQKNNPVYWTITSKKSGRFVGHAMAIGDGQVRIYEGGWTTGRIISQEEARKLYVLGKKLSKEESDKLEDRRLWELNR